MAFDTNATVQAVKPELGYLTGSSSPAVSFGGAAVGVVYTVQTCDWSVVAGRLHLTLDIELSNKGSSTGELSIATNVPVAYVAQGSTPLALWINNVAAGKGERAVFAQIDNGGRGVRIFEVGATGGGTAFTNADLTNTTRIRLSGSCRVAQP